MYLNFCAFALFHINQLMYCITVFTRSSLCLQWINRAVGSVGRSRTEATAVGYVWQSLLLAASNLRHWNITLFGPSFWASCSLLRDPNGGTGEQPFSKNAKSAFGTLAAINSAYFHLYLECTHTSSAFSDFYFPLRGSPLKTGEGRIISSPDQMAIGISAVRCFCFPLQISENSSQRSQASASVPHQLPEACRKHLARGACYQSKTNTFCLQP